MDFGRCVHFVFVLLNTMPIILDFQMVKPAEEVTTIEDLAVVEGYERNPHGNHTLKIGVDTE